MSNAYRRANRRLAKAKFKADPAVPATEATAKQNVDEMPTRKGVGQTQAQKRMAQVGKDLATICSLRAKTLAEASASSRVPKDQECWVDRHGRAQFRLRAEISDALKALDGDLIELGNELFPQVPDRMPQHSPLQTQGEKDDEGFKEISDALEEINQHADEVVDELKAHKERLDKVDIPDFTDEEWNVFDKEFTRCGHDHSPVMIALIKAVYARKFPLRQREQPAVPPEMSEAIHAARKDAQPQDGRLEYFTLVSDLVRGDFSPEEWKLYLKLKTNSPEMRALLRGLQEKKEAARKDAPPKTGNLLWKPCATCFFRECPASKQPCHSCVDFKNWRDVNAPDPEPYADREPA